MHNLKLFFAAAALFGASVSMLRAESIMALNTSDVALSAASALPVAAASADDQPLKQGRSFTWGAVATIFSMCLAIGTQLCQIGFVVLPTDVASMRLSHEKQPLLLGKGLDVQ